MISPGLYPGAIMHRRLRAPPHRFLYQGFWLAWDVDRMATKLKFFSRDRFNLFSLDARDHADGKPGPLRPKIEALCGGLDVSGAMILLTTPRLLGFVFNPLSAFFCHDAQGAPSAIAWEVSNTFGARHTYVIPVEPSLDGVVRQSARKLMHVSPFLGMAYAYQFRVEVRGEALKIGVIDRGAEGPALAATLTAQRREMTDGALLRLFLSAPLATLKVVAAIHWEALRLWLKGAKFRSAPPGAEQPIAAHASSLQERDENLNPMKAVSEAADIRLRSSTAEVSPGGQG
jgi:DUF1365 family protein